MVKDKLHTAALNHFFKDNRVFNTKSISTFYKSIETDISQETINWRIYTLAKKGILKRVGRGKFTLGEVNYFLHEITSKLIKLNSQITKGFPYLKFCIWNSSILNEFTIHQTNQSYILVEVEKESTQAIFFYLKEKKYSTFLEPTKEVFEKYIAENKKIIIVKPLITEAPTQKIKNINTATLEKILVDIFCDDIIFSAFQGNEMRTIYNEAFAKYSINENRLLRYAGRRGKKEEIKEYIKTNLG